MSDILQHVIELKEAVAANTALLREARDDVRALAQSQVDHDSRITLLEFWPKAGKMVLGAIIGLAGFVGTVYGLVKAIEPSHPTPRHQEIREDRVSPSLVNPTSR